MATESLSKASPYEVLFRTRHRGPGRPAEDDGLDTEPMFAYEGHPVFQRVAQRRAYAVVHEENKDRLREVFRKELKVLERRGLETVAADSRIRLAEDSDLVGAR
jgi:hypothetical protein